MKKIKLLAALLMLGFVLTGCSLFKDKEKTYVHNEEVLQQLMVS